MEYISITEEGGRSINRRGREEAKPVV